MCQRSSAGWSTAYNEAPALAAAARAIVSVSSSSEPPWNARKPNAERSSSTSSTPGWRNSSANTPTTLGARAAQCATAAEPGDGVSGRYSSPVTTLQTTFTEEELLTSLPVAEPLVAGGVRCHGGFDDDGTYVSPRTANRWPAIRAWQEQHAREFATTPLLDVGLDTWPGAYPNVAQARFLIE